MSATLTPNGWDVNDSTVRPLQYGYDSNELPVLTGDGAAAVKALSRGTTITGALAGDSVTEENFVSANSQFSAQARWWPIANALAGQRYTLLNNAGYSGDYTTARGAYPGLLARLNSPDTGLGTPGARVTTNGGPGVIPFDPDFCVVHIGLNDLYGSQDSAATITANLEQIYRRLMNAGITVVACTIIAVNSATANYAAMIDEHLAVNAWIRSFAKNTKGVVLCDFFAATVNATDATAIQGLAANYRDGALHPNNVGGYLMAVELVRALATAFPGASPSILPRSNLETIATAASAGVLPVNILPNPLLTGTTAAANGGNAAITGNVPSAPVFALSAGSDISAATFSVIAREDGYGQDLVCDITATAGTTQAFVQISWATQHANAVVGGEYIAMCEATIQGNGGTGNPVNLSGINMRVQYNPGGVNNFMDTLAYSTTDKAYPKAATFVLATPEPIVYTSASGVTNFRPFVLVNFSGAGSARIKIGRVGLIRIA